MIIKSLSRKARSYRAPRGGAGNLAGEKQGRAGGSKSPFLTLARYMNRGIETEDGQAVLWHNLYGSQRMCEEDLVQAFEDNARRLHARANGNVLYHEILSFSRGHRLRDAELFRAIADIGDTYLAARAPGQLGYGVIHRDTDHVHLHLMVSANAIGRSERVRLSKKEFADIQRQIEVLALERYPELAQTPIYTRARDREAVSERLKTVTQEQALRQRTQAPSRKEALKVRLHQMFERASSPEELARLMQAESLSFYTRGQSIGVTQMEAQGTERKHRLSTLGLLAHYEQMNARLLAPQDAPRTHEAERAQGAAKSFAKERFPNRGGASPEAQPQTPESTSVPYPKTNQVRRREDELRQTLEKKQRAEDRQDPGKDDDFDR